METVKVVADRRDRLHERIPKEIEGLGNQNGRLTAYTVAMLTFSCFSSLGRQSVRVWNEWNHDQASVPPQAETRHARWGKESGVNMGRQEV